MQATLCPLFIVPDNWIVLWLRSSCRLGHDNLRKIEITPSFAFHLLSPRNSKG